MDGRENLQEVKCGITPTVWTSAVMTTIQQADRQTAPLTCPARCSLCKMLSLGVCVWVFFCFITLLIVSSSALPLPAQGYVCARRECMDPSVMSATRVSSTSAALAAGPASVATTPTTAIHSRVSLHATDALCHLALMQSVFDNVDDRINRM